MRMGDPGQNRRGGTADLDVWATKPRRLCEIWKLDRDTNTVVAMGLEAVVQFNAVASAMWLRFDGEHTVGSIVQELARAYPDQDRGRIEIDTLSLISELAANRLVTLDWSPLRGAGPPLDLKGVR